MVTVRKGFDSLRGGKITKMKTNKWQIIQAIVGVILLLLNVYQYIELRGKDKLLGKFKTEAIEAAIKLSGAYAVINQLKNDIEGYDINLETYLALAKENAKLADKYFIESNHYKMQRDELIEKLDKPPVLDLSDDDHVTYFLKWTK